MKLTSVLLLASCLTTLAAMEEELHRRYPVTTTGNLVVDVDFGSIDVRTNSTGEIAVDVWRKISRRSKDDEEAFLRENPVTITRDGASVTVRARHKSENNGNWFSNARNRNEARYIITVPPQCSASLNTAGGPISVSDVEGKVNAGTSGGGLDFTRLHGPLDGSTSGGPIQVTDCAGALKVGTSGGGITVTGGSGSLNGDTSGGPIKVSDFHGDTHVETSGGGIAIENVIGQIEGSTSGGPIDVTLPSSAPDSVKLSTSGGGVTARLPENAAFDLDAETSGGSVSSELPVTVIGKMERGRLNGAVNGGGKSIRLETSGGNIHLEKLSTHYTGRD
jgi:DUF4097 and DUF4098 domain-containing protein YvlB